MTKWSTEPAPSGLDIEFVTADGKELAGQVSFVATHKDHTGKSRNLHQLRKGPRGVFEVARWRRVES